MPEEPIPEQDPVVTKSYAMWYVVSMVILMATLFWALWDEAVGQRPWKAYQRTWADRYTAFLHVERKKAEQNSKGLQNSSEYQQLQAAADAADAQAKPRRDDLQKQITGLSQKIQAVQDVFTDKRAYVNAIIYKIQTDDSKSGKESKSKDLADYKKGPFTVKYPDGSKKDYDFAGLEKTYNDLKADRTQLSAELGDVLKPVSDARNKVSEYLANNTVQLAPNQIDGLLKKTADDDPKIQQINVADANIVDRCESCHMGTREPLKITAVAMATASGHKKPEIGRAHV